MFYTKSESELQQLVGAVRLPFPALALEVGTRLIPALDSVGGGDQIVIVMRSPQTPYVVERWRPSLLDYKYPDELRQSLATRLLEMAISSYAYAYSGLWC